MKKFIFILFIIFVSSGVQSMAQDTNNQKSTSSTVKGGKKAAISGIVVDGISKEPLIGAVIFVLGTEKGSIADDKGKFNIKNLTLNEEVKLEFSYVGYKTKLLSVKITDDNFMLKDTVRLDSDMDLETVEIVGKVQPVKMKGDTTVFNAAAYKTNPDATAGDLLAKMPGFEKNDDGTVNAQGEKVAKVYVDGKGFFKNDLKAALETLPAGAVEGIELFDEMSDKAKFTGFDDGNRNKVINIVTKAKSNSAKIFDATGGYGYKDVYMGSVLYTQLKEDGNLSIGGGTNNINLPVAGYGRRFGRGGGGGLSTQIGAQINYSKTFKNGTDLSLHYTYSNNKTETESRTYQTYFPTDDYDFRTYNSISSSIGKTNNHNFGFDFQKDLGANKKTRISFRPTITASHGDNSSTSWNNSVINSDSTMMDNRNSSTPRSISAGGNLNIMRKFTENNYLTLSVTGNYNDNSSKGRLEGITVYNKEALIFGDTTTQNQRSKSFSDGSRLGANLEYSHRLSRRSGLTLTYDFNNNWNNSDRKTYDLTYDEMTGEYEKLDSIKSNEMHRNNLTNNVGIRYNYRVERFNFDLSARYENAYIKDDQLFPYENFKSHTFNGAVFNANVRYSLKDKKGDFTFGYSGTPSYPSIDQLQDVLNNENSLQLSSGNSNLKQEFNNSFNLRYSWTLPMKGIYLGVFGRASNSINGVVRNTVLYDEDTTIDVNGLPYEVRKGTQYTTYTNMDGKWDLRLGSTFSFPLNPIKSKINLNLGYNYAKTPSMYNNRNFVSTDNSYTFGLGINSSVSENVDFNIRNMSTYRDSRSERTASSNKSTFTNNLTVEANFIIWKGLFVNVDYTMRYNKTSIQTKESPYSNMFNAAAGKKFKGDTWEIRFSAYDILQQNRNVRQSVSDIYISDTYSNNIGRYFSMSVSYRFNSFRKGMNVKDANKSREQRPGGGGQRGGWGGGTVRRTM